MLLAVQQDIDNAQSLTAQRERILGTGRCFAAAEGGHNVIHFIRNTQDPPDFSLRQDITRKPGQVLLKDTFADIRFFSVQTGILPAHDALQFGKFRHHAGNQIALAELGRAFQIRQRQTALLPEMNHLHQLLQTLALIVHIAQAFLEDNGLNLFFIGFQFLFPVFVKEEFRVTETGPQHPFITVGHILQKRFAAVPYGNKFVQQFAVFTPHREIALMIAHRRDDSRFRQRQIFFFKFSAQRRGILYQIIDFFQQIRRNFNLSTFFPGQFGNLLPDHLPAFILICDDKILFQNFFIVIRHRNFNFLVAQETVTHGVPVRLDIRNGNRNDFRTKQRYQPVNGAQETEIEIRPAHMVGERNIGQDFLQHMR